MVFLSIPCVLMTSKHLRAVRHPLQKEGKPLQVCKPSTPDSPSNVGSGIRNFPPIRYCVCIAPQRPTLWCCGKTLRNFRVGAYKGAAICISLFLFLLHHLPLQSSRATLSIRTSPCAYLALRSATLLCLNTASRRSRIIRTRNTLAGSRRVSEKTHTPRPIAPL